MVLAIMKVTDTTAQVVSRKPIPAGIIGAQVAFEFGCGWEGRSRTVVFQAGEVTKDVVLSAGEDTAVIPAEVVAQPCHSLRVGIYGADSWGTALPTLWAELGRVHYGADPSGDESTDPSLPVWAQIQAQMDSLQPNSGGSGGMPFKTDETLTLKNGILSVNTTDDMQRDNTLPITSAGVFSTVGNIEALLKTI